MVLMNAASKALSGPQWGLANGDDAVVGGAWRTFQRPPDAPLAHS